MHEQPPYPKSSSSAAGKSALKYMYKVEFDQVGKAAARSRVTSSPCSRSSGAIGPSVKVMNYEVPAAGAGLKPRVHAKACTTLTGAVVRRSCAFAKVQCMGVLGLVAPP